MTASSTDRPAAPGGDPLRGRDLALLLVAAAALQAIAWATLLALFSAGLMGYGLHDLADTLLYHFYAASFALGRRPYADLAVEYPPLANLVFLLAPSGGSVAEYERWFSAAMMTATTAAAALTTAAAAAAWRSMGRAFAVAVAYAGLTLCAGALPLNRYDAVVALTLAAALLWLAVRRPLPAAVSLGLGFALKLTPALLLPLTLSVRDSGRTRALALAGFLLAAALPFVPFLLDDGAGAAIPFTYHSRRPLQLESVLGSPWVAGALTGRARPRVVHAYGSQNFAGGGPDAVAAASPWLLTLGTAGVYALVWRRRRTLSATPGLLPTAALAVLLVAVCLSKVLSPQFLIWTFPVVALCVAQPLRLARVAAAATALATLLTQFEFPARYWDLVDLQSGPLALLLARNATLVVAAVLAVIAVARLRPPESPSSISTS